MSKTPNILEYAATRQKIKRSGHSLLGIASVVIAPVGIWFHFRNSFGSFLDYDLHMLVSECGVICTLAALIELFYRRKRKLLPLISLGIYIIPVLAAGSLYIYAGYMMNTYGGDGPQR